MATPIVAQEKDREASSRIFRGRRLYREQGAEIVLYIDGSFGVPSATKAGLVYHVNLKAQTCKCPDKKNQSEPCKHMFAAELKALEHRRKDRSQTEEARRRSLERKKDRIVFTPDQIAANLARMS